MATWKLVPLLVTATLVLSAMSQELPSQFLGCPGSPWCPTWTICNYTETQGPFCHDCNTRLICTAVGGLIRPCWIGKPYCVLGKCVASPSEECAATTEGQAPGGGGSAA